MAVGDLAADVAGLGRPGGRGTGQCRGGRGRGRSGQVQPLHLHKMDGFIAVVQGVDVEIGAGMIAAAWLAVAKAGVGQGPTDGLPCACVGLLHHARQFVGIAPGVIAHLETVRAHIVIRNVQPHPLVGVEQIAILDIEIHVGIAGGDVGAARVTPFREGGDVPHGHGASARNLIVLHHEEIVVSPLRIPGVFGFAHGHPGGGAVFDGLAQVIQREAEDFLSLGRGHQVPGENEVIRMLVQAIVHAPHGVGEPGHVLRLVRLPADGHLLPPFEHGIILARPF